MLHNGDIRGGHGGCKYYIYVVYLKLTWKNNGQWSYVSQNIEAHAPQNEHRIGMDTWTTQGTKRALGRVTRRATICGSL